MIVIALLVITALLLSLAAWIGVWTTDPGGGPLRIGFGTLATILTVVAALVCFALSFYVGLR